MKKIRTVCGDIRPEELGYTLIHEHAIVELPMIFGPMTESLGLALGEKYPESKFECTIENVQFLNHGGWIGSKSGLTTKGDDYIDFWVKELEAYKKAGGNSINEVSYHGCHWRPLSDLKIMSERSGVHIIACTGCGSMEAETRPREFRDKSENELKALFERDVAEGIDGIKPGTLKVLMTNTRETDVYRALTRLSAETGMPVQIHSQPPMNPDDLTVLANMAKDEFGTDPGKICFCHVGQYITKDSPMLVDYIRKGSVTLYLDWYERLLDTGVYVSFDNFSSSDNEVFGQNNMDQKLTMTVITRLLDKGYASQIMLGHDMCAKVQGTQLGGYGYTRVPEFVCPTLSQMGYEDAVERMTVKNPMEYLSF